MSDEISGPMERFGDLTTRFGGHARIYDMRSQAERFLASVNDAQRLRMRNIRKNRGLAHVSSLPGAARSFAMEPVAAMDRHELRSVIYRLDMAVHRVWSATTRDQLASHKPSSWTDLPARTRVTKRWHSGLFVILPDDGGDGTLGSGQPIALAYERAVVWPWVMSDAWWTAVESAQENPPPIDSDSVWRIGG